MRCFYCFNELEENTTVCPFCDHDLNETQKEIYHLAQGTMLRGRYTIGVVLGFGGFGVVYKAYDEQLERIVAIKEYFPTIYLSREAGTKEVILFDKKNLEAFGRGKEEFLQEARNIARYNTHPNVVHIYDFFEENGTAYFVMEHLYGYTLRDYIRHATEQGKVLSLKTSVDITKAVLCALESTHADGIIHRDVKPNNIYILGDGTVKLFDFGAARFSDTEQEKTRTVILTPGYAPPEQYQKKSKQGAFTDIYAVGAMLYEMLTGVRPEESINRKVQDNVVPPTRLNTKIPEPIENAVMRAMAIQPEIRFQDAESFLKALSARNVRNADAEIRRRKRRRNFFVLLIFGVVMAVGAYAGYRVFQSYRDVVLADADIEVWLPAIDGDIAGTKDLYEKMTEEYLQNNSQITVNYTVYEEDKYEDALEEALASGTGPDLFAIPDNSVWYATYLADVSELYEESGFDLTKYYFLDDYRGYFEEKRMIPLLCDLPVTYENASEEGLEDSSDYEAFLAGDTNYSGMVSDFLKVQQDMAGNYQIREEISEGRAGEFENYWGVNAESEVNEQAASVRLLYYYFSDNAQELLAIEQDQGIPLNKNVWDVYMEINSDFAFFTDLVGSVSFKGN